MYLNIGKQHKPDFLPDFSRSTVKFRLLFYSVAGGAAGGGGMWLQPFLNGRSDEIQMVHYIHTLYV